MARAGPLQLVRPSTGRCQRGSGRASIQRSRRDGLLGWTAPYHYAPLIPRAADAFERWHVTATGSSLRPAWHVSSVAGTRLANEGSLQMKTELSTQRMPRTSSVAAADRLCVGVRLGLAWRRSGSNEQRLFSAQR